MGKPKKPEKDPLATHGEGSTEQLERNGSCYRRHKIIVAERASCVRRTVDFGN